MKRFALLLITVILSLNCMAQSNNTTTIKLHQGEFINQSHTTRIQQTNETLLFDKMTNEYVYTTVEQMPSYKGSNSAFMNDFISHFNYAPEQNENIQTTLRVQFVINTKGQLIGARIYNKGLNKLTNFEKAGLKALEQMQDWTPGIHNNKKVNVLLTIPIHIDFQ